MTDPPDEPAEVDTEIGEVGERVTAALELMQGLSEADDAADLYHAIERAERHLEGIYFRWYSGRAEGLLEDIRVICDQLREWGQHWKDEAEELQWQLDNPDPVESSPRGRDQPSRRILLQEDDG